MIEVVVCVVDYKEHVVVLHYNVFDLHFIYRKRFSPEQSQGVFQLLLLLFYVFVFSLVDSNHFVRTPSSVDLFQVFDAIVQCVADCLCGVKLMRPVVYLEQSPYVGPDLLDVCESLPRVVDGVNFLTDAVELIGSDEILDACNDDERNEDKIRSVS